MAGMLRLPELIWRNDVSWEGPLFGLLPLRTCVEAPLLNMLWSCPPIWRGRYDNRELGDGDGRRSGLWL